MLEHTKKEYEANISQLKAADGEHIFIVKEVVGPQQSKKNADSYFYIIRLTSTSGGGAVMFIPCTNEGNLKDEFFSQGRWNRLCKDLQLPYGETGFDAVVGNVFCGELKTKGEYQNLKDSWPADDYEKDQAAKFIAESTIPEPAF